MKPTAIAGLFLLIGVYVGSSLHPLPVHAQQHSQPDSSQTAQPLAPARVVEVNLKDGGLVYERLEVTAVSLSCFAGQNGPKCYVLVRGN
ncbi:MAG: hypothetical protein DMG96_24775 [Acidobacteria bacterium]|nr:MAG: hypothetical protein DMG96_24775 [Acidobacteriota bacterium]